MSRPSESYEPNPADELDPGAVTLLRAAVAERSEAERHLLEAVRAAREAGMPWSAIGSFVGTSGEAARRQRYGKKVALIGSGARCHICSQNLIGVPVQRFLRARS